MIFALQLESFPSLSYVLVIFHFDGVQSAVTWLCFAPNSEQVITASKDGSIRIWNINGMSNYALWKFLVLNVFFFFFVLDTLQ